MARQGNSKRLILHRTHWYIIHNGMRVELAQICRSWLLSQNEWPYHIFGVFWCGVGCLQFNTIKTIQYTHGLGKVWLCLQPFRIDELAICINFQKFATVMPVSVMLIQYNSKTWGEKYWTTEKWGEQKKTKAEATFRTSQSRSNRSIHAFIIIIQTGTGIIYYIAIFAHHAIHTHRHHLCKRPLSPLESIRRFQERVTRGWCDDIEFIPFKTRTVTNRLDILNDAMASSPSSVTHIIFYFSFFFYCYLFIYSAFAFLFLLPVILILSFARPLLKWMGYCCANDDNSAMMATAPRGIYGIEREMNWWGSPSVTWLNNPFIAYQFLLSALHACCPLLQIPRSGCLSSFGICNSGRYSSPIQSSANVNKNCYEFSECLLHERIMLTRGSNSSSILTSNLIVARTTDQSSGKLH